MCKRNLKCDWAALAQPRLQCGNDRRDRRRERRRWRELLAGGGIKRAAVAGSGIFKDAASDAAIRSLFFAGTIRDWQLILPDFGTVEGPFQIVALEFSADHAGEVTFEIALESAGELSFTAA